MNLSRNIVHVCFSVITSISLAANDLPVGSLKKTIGFQDLDSPDWEVLNGISSICPDGKYICYTGPGKHSYLQSAFDRGKLKKEVAAVANFSSDSCWACMECPDKILLLQLTTFKETELFGASAMQVWDSKGESYLAYEKNAMGKTLTIRKLSTGVEQVFRSIRYYAINPEGGSVIIVQGESTEADTLTYLNVTTGEVSLTKSTRSGSDFKASPDGYGLVYVAGGGKAAVNDYELHWCEVRSKVDTIVHKGETKPHSLGFNQQGTQLLFTTAKGIFYYKKGMAEAVMKLSANSPLIPAGFTWAHDAGAHFSSNGGIITFYVLSDTKGNKERRIGGVNVWHYKDQILQAAQNNPEKFSSLSREAWMSVEGNFVQVIAEPVDETKAGDNWALVMPARFENEVYEGKTTSWPYLLSLREPKQVRVPYSRNPTDADSQSVAQSTLLSPDEKWVLFYDASENRYCSFEIETGIVRDLTTKVDAPWGVDASMVNRPTPDPYSIGMPRNRPRPRGPIGWLEGNKKVLIYDEFDIWSLTADGSEVPVNLTKGYGKAHHLVLEIDQRITGEAIGREPISLKGQIILRAYDTVSHERGYALSNLDDLSEPEIIFFGPYDRRSRLEKAKNANVWFCLRSSPDSAPNIYVSRDLKNFDRLTDFQPQKKFNWYTSEIVTWRLPNGETCQGVLRKPENLDPAKKYPVIFNYYEISTQNAFNFEAPSWIYDVGINVPYFTSNGYLVFSPDMHYKVGHPLRGALECVVSAADALAKLPFVDTTKMALSGHSWGGYETNYIVTHTDRFAAAASGAGGVDAISDYGGLCGLGLQGVSQQGFFEYEQNRIGATLWQRPDLYRENSSILSVDQITTPILLLHNAEDAQVSFAQGLEFFTALRRLGKRAWLLQYDGEGHGLGKAENAKDLTVRMVQFFDHYLKNAPAPRWMTEGISAKRKGLDTGLELDLRGIEP